MSEFAAIPVVRQGAAAAAAVAALVLLLVFYSVVAGAVERAAKKRSDALAEPVALGSAAAGKVGTTASFTTRKISLARAGD